MGFYEGQTLKKKGERKGVNALWSPGCGPDCYRTRSVPEEEGETKRLLPQRPIAGSTPQLCTVAPRPKGGKEKKKKKGKGGDVIATQEPKFPFALRFVIAKKGGRGSHDPHIDGIYFYRTARPRGGF